MEIAHGIVTKIYSTDCAYGKAIIPDRIVSIGNSAAFNFSYMSKIELPNSLREIKGYAFANCENLETIIIPDSVTSIGERSFTNCKSLKSITLPSGLSKIGDSVFSGCENLEEVVLPESLEEIPYRAFANCKKLRRIVIPNSVKKIDWGCFTNCESLEEIVIPDSVTKIGKQLFLNCRNLKIVKLPKQLNIEVEVIPIPDEPKVTLRNTLPEETFRGCKSLLKIELPQNITSVGDNCFEDCEKLIEIPQNVSSFGRCAFKNCRSLTNITINPKATYLSNGMFEGCIRLVSLQSPEVRIGERCFRSCISLPEVPSCVLSYNKYAFENCISITEAKNLDGSIPEGAFRGCKNLITFNDCESVSSIGKSAFESCSRLESFKCSDRISSISPNTFANCDSLTSITLSQFVDKIGKSAFNGCKTLKKIQFPTILKSIGANAFKNCASIESIYLPECLESIGIGAFSYMGSLERIEVSSRNKKFLSHDNLCLIEAQTEGIIQYAIGNHNPSYSIVPYTWKIDELNCELIRPIRSIGEYAFAGTSYLQELTLDSAVEYLEKTAFENSDNLKTLHIQRLPFFSSQGFRVTNHKRPDYNSGNFPFESVVMLGDISSIEIDGFSGFKKLKQIQLPHNRLIGIRQQAFKNCDNLTEIFIPDSVSSIENDSFAPETTLEFENGLRIKSSSLQSLSRVRDGKLYTLQGYYLLERNNCITRISKREIEKSFANSRLIINEPSLVLNYLVLLNLLDHDYKFLKNGVFVKALSDDVVSINLSTQEKHDKEKETYQLVSPTKEEKPSIEMYDNLLESIYALVENYRNNCQIENEDRHSIFGKQHGELSKSMATLFIQYFDANMKRMIELSGVLDNSNTAIDNMKDLLKIAKILGAFEENPITRQKAITFINDNILCSSNENNNPYRIVGDDIHRKFNELKPREEFDSEFARFFMENYKEICNHEASHSGFICRAYNNFVEIAKTSTSNKGFQRRLLVTFQKCIHYLASQKFDGVTKETEEIAILLGDWFDKNSAFETGITIVNESQEAPRNIFITFKISEDNIDELVFDNDKEHDLKEPLSDIFSYEWLPKQDLRNLLLGKYCDCCAHVEGAGAGIMRASMITLDHQNLIIRNNFGEIIGKSTVYVNRQGKYAVFNNIESNRNYRSPEDKEKIYRAFMRGAKAFMEKYNECNPNNPLINMTIGTSRNTVKELFEKNGDQHPLSAILGHPKYGNWALNGYGGYVGDATTQQRLVLKR